MNPDATPEPRQPAPKARYRNATAEALYELSQAAASRGDAAEARRLFDLADRRAMQPKHIAPRRGRPPLPPTERTESRSIRLTDARWHKLKALGLDWLAKQIDRTPDPT